MKRALALVILLAGLVALVLTVNQFDPLREWLAWRYLGVIALATAWLFSVTSLGFAVLRRVKGLRFRERLVLSSAVGVLSFSVLVFLVGLVGGLGAITFVSLLLLGVAVGGWPLVKTCRRVWRRTGPLSGAWWAALGVIGVLIIWLPLLTPRHFTYDARWYHLAIAEQFATGGRIGPFVEGWFPGTLPHLWSWLSAWALTAPLGTFERYELVAHLELALFLFTLFGVDVLVSRLLPRPRVRSAWVGRFLFPGVLLYDSSLGGGADHVLAFWAIPIFLAWWSAWRRPSLALGALLGACTAGAMMTKYQGVFFFLPLTVFVLRGLMRRELRRPAAAAIVAAMVAWSPHWLANLVWYGNPVFPLLAKVLGGHPLVPGAEPHLTDAAFAPQGTVFEKLVATARGTATFGFAANDWETFHGQRPVFGSLFLVAFALLVLWRRRWVVALAVSSAVAIPIWYVTQHQDRYLQALAPWMAVCVVTVFAWAWRTWKISRPLLGALLAFQMLHVADLWALPAHAIIHQAPLHDVLELVAQSDGNAPERWVSEHYGLSPVGTQLPPSAKLLVHELSLTFGIGRPVVRDQPGEQGAIVYRQLADPRAVWDVLHGMGVTHVFFANQPSSRNLVADDLAFYRFAQQVLRGGSFVAGQRLVEVPSTPPPSRPYELRVLGCRLESLPLATFDDARWNQVRQQQCQTAPDEALAAIDSADAVLLDNRLFPNPPESLARGFTRLFDRNEFSIWSRNP